MKKQEIKDAIENEIADLCKVPVPGVADIAIDILTELSGSVESAKSEDINLEKLIGCIAVIGAKRIIEAAKCSK